MPWGISAPGEIGEGKKEVDVGGERFDIDALAEDTFPAPEGGDVGAAFVDRTLAELEPGLKHLDTLTVERAIFSGLAIVGHEDDEGVIPRIPFVELLHEQAEVVVDVDWFRGH